MEKRIKSYKEFLESSKVNEGIVDWVKEKFSKIGEYFSKLKGEALVSIAASIIPKELFRLYKIAGWCFCIRIFNDFRRNKTYGDGSWI